MDSFTDLLKKTILGASTSAASKSIANINPQTIGSVATNALYGGIPATQLPQKFGEYIYNPQQGIFPASPVRDMIKSGNLDNQYLQGKMNKEDYIKQSMPGLMNMGQMMLSLQQGKNPSTNDSSNMMKAEEAMSDSPKSITQMGLPTDRPAHQQQFEDAFNSKNYEKARQVVDAIPDSDPYKESMKHTVDQLVPKDPPYTGELDKSLVSDLKDNMKYLSDNKLVKLTPLDERFGDTEQDLLDNRQYTQEVKSKIRDIVDIISVEPKLKTMLDENTLKILDDYGYGKFARNTPYTGELQDIESKLKGAFPEAQINNPIGGKAEGQFYLTTDGKVVDVSSSGAHPFALEQIGAPQVGIDGEDVVQKYLDQGGIRIRAGTIQANDPSSIRGRYYNIELGNKPTAEQIDLIKSLPDVSKITYSIKDPTTGKFIESPLDTSPGGYGIVPATKNDFINQIKSFFGDQADDVVIKTIPKKLQPLADVAKNFDNPDDFYNSIRPIDRDMLGAWKPQGNRNQSVYDFFAQIKGQTPVNRADLLTRNTEIDPSLEKQVIRKFGITDNPDHAAFITSDGEMINGSGGGYSRDIDHREISSSVMDSGGSEGLIDYMNKTKNIRVSPNGDSINIDSTYTPNENQIAAIEKMSEGKKIYADISNFNGDKVKSGEFDSVSSWLKWMNKNVPKDQQGGVDVKALLGGAGALGAGAAIMKGAKSAEDFVGKLKDKLIPKVEARPMEPMDVAPIDTTPQSAPSFNLDNASKSVEQLIMKNPMLRKVGLLNKPRGVVEQVMQNIGEFQFSQSEDNLKEKEKLWNNPGEYIANAMAQQRDLEKMKDNVLQQNDFTPAAEKIIKSLPIVVDKNLPAGGNELGNVAFDPKNNRLVVSEDYLFALKNKRFNPGHGVGQQMAVNFIQAMDEAVRRKTGENYPTLTNSTGFAPEIFSLMTPEKNDQGQWLPFNQVNTTVGPYKQNYDNGNQDQKDAIQSQLFGLYGTGGMAFNNEPSLQRRYQNILKGKNVKTMINTEPRLKHL